MRGLAVLAAGLILALAGGSVLIIDRLYARPPESAPGAVASSEARKVAVPTPAPSPPARAPAADLDLRAVRAAQAQASSTAAVEPPAGPPPELPPAPPVESWSSVEIANPHGAGSMGPAILRELGRLKPILAECFTPAGQANYGRLGEAASKLRGGDVRRHVGAAIVLLSLQGDGSELEIVDAPVESRGAASDGTLNCAQAKLRGARLAVVTEGPVRARFRYVLRP